MTGATFRASDGSNATTSGTPAIAVTHYIAENSIKITPVTSAKILDTDAFAVNIAALGKNSVNLSGFNFSVKLAGYTGSGVFELLDDNNVVIATGTVSTANANVNPVVLTSHNTSIDANSSKTYKVRIV